MDKFHIKKLEGYTIMSNHHLRDKTLSHSARGLLSFMLSLPEDWDYSFNGLVTISKEGKFAIRNMLNELKEAKYVKITQYRNAKGFFQYNYDVYEVPYDMASKNRDYPTPSYQTTGKQTSNNYPQINTKEINTNKQIDKIDILDKTSKQSLTLIDELVRVGYINNDDPQKELYESLFKNYLQNGSSPISLYSAIHYITPKVINRKFLDEDGKEITNKFGYLKSSIASNIRKLESYNQDLYSDDPNSSFWDNFEL